MHDLNFFSDPLKKNFIMPQDRTAINFGHPHTPLFWTYVGDAATKIVNQDILNWLETKNLKMHTVNIFKTQPHFIAGIHIDGDVNYLRPAINWVLSGFNSEQIYYKPTQGLSIVDCLTDNQELANKKEYYRPFDESKLIKTESKRIIGPTLIRINVPHRVANYDDEWRLTVSLRFDYKDDKFFSWLDILKLFKDNLK